MNNQLRQGVMNIDSQTNKPAWHQRYIILGPFMKVGGAGDSTGRTATKMEGGRGKPRYQLALYDNWNWKGQHIQSFLEKTQNLLWKIRSRYKLLNFLFISGYLAYADCAISGDIM